MIYLHEHTPPKAVNKATLPDCSHLTHINESPTFFVGHKANTRTPAVSNESPVLGSQEPGVYQECQGQEAARSHDETNQHCVLLLVDRPRPTTPAHRGGISVKLKVILTLAMAEFHPTGTGYWTF